VVLVIRSLLGVSTPAGWATVIVLVLVLGGTQLTMVGVMGEYLWRSVEESRGRPLYVVRDVRVAGTAAVVGRRHRRLRAKAPDAKDAKDAKDAQPESVPD
jgi:hypothetical protein